MRPGWSETWGGIGQVISWGGLRKDSYQGEKSGLLGTEIGLPCSYWEGDG